MEKEILQLWVPVFKFTFPSNCHQWLFRLIYFHTKFGPKQIVHFQISYLLTSVLKPSLKSALY